MCLERRIETCDIVAGEKDIAWSFVMLLSSPHHGWLSLSLISKRVFHVEATLMTFDNISKCFVYIENRSYEHGSLQQLGQNTHMTLFIYK